MYSVSSANVEVTELLLDKGANPEFNKGTVMYTVYSTTLCMLGIFL